jgi:cyclopropane-fatty-acyl-phospholipid synthase
MINALLEKDLIPDALIRMGIRSLLRQRLAEEASPDPERQQEKLNAFIASMNASPVAILTQAANEQHYELPTRFFQLCLGPHLKYSSGYYTGATASLEAAEEMMLQLTASRAGIQNGDRVLELGCGWGSLSLFNAARFPRSKFVGVSNSRTQKQFIDAKAKERGIKNLAIITADMNRFKAPGKFDRAVSVEMFEHMRNWRQLLGRLSGWLRPGGTFFMHIFTHRQFAYPFEVRDSSDWMARYFFSGGMMPSDSLPFYFQEALSIKKHWIVSGRHYQQTAEDWLKNMDKNREEILSIFRQTYGPEHALKWWAYWRVFFMSCAELWGYANGSEWLLSHYLFEKPR